MIFVKIIETKISTSNLGIFWLISIIYFYTLTKLNRLQRKQAITEEIRLQTIEVRDILVTSIKYAILFLLQICQRACASCHQNLFILTNTRTAVYVRSTASATPIACAVLFCSFSVRVLLHKKSEFALKERNDSEFIGSFE